MTSKTEPWLIYWPKGLDKLLKNQQPGCDIYIVGVLLPPNTIFVTSFVASEHSVLESNLLAFNKRKETRESEVAYIILGKVRYNLSKKTTLETPELKSRYWLSVECFIDGGIYIWPTSEIKTITLINYTKPKQNHHYFLSTQTPTSSQTSQRTVQVHIKKRDVDPDFVPINRCLQLINSAYLLDYFLKTGNLNNSLSESSSRYSWLDSWKLPDTFLIRSRFAQQLQFRFNQIRSFPSNKGHGLLVLVDIISGWGIGYFILCYREFLGSQLVAAIDYYSIVLLKSFIEWLMGYPAGLKINVDLTKFLGELFMWLIYLWVEWTHNWTEHASIIVILVGIVSFGFGSTVALALAGDLLSLSTLHLYWFYLVESRIYSWHISLIHSLYRLFRGKKYNVLRCRTDSCDYDVEQLILGTILFTILIFLYPTIIVYYILAATAWIIVVVLQGIVEIALGVMNHFPLYTLLCRLFYPASMPNGIYLELKSSLSNGIEIRPPTDKSYDFPIMPKKPLNSTEFDLEPSTVHFKLKSVPVSFGRLFYDYGLLLRHVLDFYSRTHFVKSLTSGRMVRHLPRFESPQLSPVLQLEKEE